MQLPFPDPEELPILTQFPSAGQPVERPGATTLNYFNYYTEIEDAFVARRGSPLMISPLDWALVESWKSTGIPLHIVLRGITQAFDKRDSQPKTPQVAFKKVNTLFYCQQSVMTEFAEFCASQVGAPSSGVEGSAAGAETGAASEFEPFPPGSVRRYLEEVAAELEKTRQSVPRHATAMFPHRRWMEALDRVLGQLRELVDQLPDGPGQGKLIHFEKLEQDLTRLEELLYEALRADAPAEVIESVTAEAAAQLKPHKKRMDTAVYQQTLENYRARQLRGRYNVPRLSLFYLRPE